MEHASSDKLTPSSSQYQPHIVVVGGGPVGVRFVQELLQKNRNAYITLFGEESYAPYNRVQLSALLSGDVNYNDIGLELPGPESPQFNFISRRVTRIDRQLKRIYDADGTPTNYDQLVLATGARPHVPNIEGLDQTGVYTFRSLKDAESLYARTSRAQHVVVVGGGLLGIETARALLKNNTHVTVVQQGQHIMNKQLDEAAGQMVQDKMEDLGIRVVTNTGVRKVLGDGRVDGVLLRSKEAIECDTVVFCTGIAPNKEMARDAGLIVHDAIVVNNQLQTSDSAVYAIGECSEHDGQTFGLVNPGYEQAAVLADVISGGGAQYLGSQESSRLKVVELPVQSIGEVVNYTKTPFDRRLTFKRNGIYRKIILQKGLVTGAVIIGEYSEANRLLETFQQQRKVSFWQSLMFKLTGRLWPSSTSSDVSTWSDSTVVCQCNYVTKGTLCSAIDSGCQCACDVSKATGAGTVCGTCKPLLQQLVDSKVGASSVNKPEKEWAWAPSLAFSMLAISIVVSILSIPGIAVGESVNAPAPFQFLWDDKFWKQVTGFTLLGLSAIGLLMSLRKRLGLSWLGKFEYWRFFHIALGLTCGVILLAHTGLHTGSNLNQLLMFNFLGILVMGALAGMVVSLSHRMKAQQSVRVKRAVNWMHIIVSWPLPVLIATHILTVYYF